MEKKTNKTHKLAKESGPDLPERTTPINKLDWMEHLEFKCFRGIELHPEATDGRMHQARP